MPAHIRQVQVVNYKSIARAVVDLNVFTAFVGRNGAGKSNFIDALAFVQDALSQSLNHALWSRGGIGIVQHQPQRRRPSAPIGLRLLIDLDEHGTADYAFDVAPTRNGGFRIAGERCSVRSARGKQSSFEVADGEFKKPIEGIRSQIRSDRLMLFAASATEEFRPVYDFLTGMRFYSIQPERLRELQDKDPGDILRGDGSNAAAVLRTLQRTEPDLYDGICRILGSVVEGLESVEATTLGPKETLVFKVDVGERRPFSFTPRSMSIGTLNVLGLLLAAYQPQQPSLLAIEEPEETVHPGAAGIITQVLIEASREAQVLITTHSPDILDVPELQDDQIRVVVMRRGNTSIALASPVSRQVIREHLFSAGELLRSDELNADLEAADTAAGRVMTSGVASLR
jgi:predicted ATPase